MRCELPDLKRCCFCIPLRRGLLVWGYIKIGLTMLIWLPLGFMFYFSLMFTGHIDPFLISTVLLLIVDFSFTISFLIAAHTKNYKLFKVYYYYIMIITVLVSIFFLVAFVTVVYIDNERQLIISIALPCMNIVAQIYLMILVRSEINKLENNCQIEFVNREGEMRVNSNMDVYTQNKEVINDLNPEKGIMAYS